MANLSNAIKNLRSERDRLASKLEKLDKAISVLGNLDSGRGIGRATTRRRRLSAAARNRIARAQRLRWAKWKAKQQQRAS
jgi:hypothetical protein